MSTLRVVYSLRSSTVYVLCTVHYTTHIIQRTFVDVMELHIIK